MSTFVKGFLCLFLILLVTWNTAAETEEEREALKIAFRNLPRVNFSLATANDPSKITYKLYNRVDPETYIALTQETVKTQKFERAKTFLFIHGFAANDSSPWYNNAKENYFKIGPYNIIYIDWSAYGNLSFEISAANVKPVGQYIATFLKNSRITPESIHLIGHSMGGQLAAFVGKSSQSMYGKKIGRITGLDPSGRMFSNKEMKLEEILNKYDAVFVDVVHTNIQIYGYANPCGHVDFYPNGGSNQPGCPDDEPREICNHHRSYKLFVESITKFAKTSEIDFEEDENYNIIISPKSGGKRPIFGEYIDLSTKGVFTFETNPSAPFLKVNN